MSVRETRSYIIVNSSTGYRFCLLDLIPLPKVVKVVQSNPCKFNPNLHVTWVFVYASGPFLTNVTGRPLPLYPPTWPLQSVILGPPAQYLF